MCEVVLTVVTVVVVVIVGGVSGGEVRGQRLFHLYRSARLKGVTLS